jgi:hypothetical protein
MDFIRRYAWGFYLGFGLACVTPSPLTNWKWWVIGVGVAILEGWSRDD